ncbi:MAG: MBL fold metallo-hydrolase [Candidatus Melainabacteria bacterium]|nr:MBL fold metallo-hydrolase [Candidatus Melainabacteria bacterium]
MTSSTWKVGNIKITPIVEVEAGNIIQQIIPNATTDNIAKISWLKPHFVDDKNRLKALVQAFIVQTPDACILVDTCIGNDKKRSEIAEWNNLQTDFLKCLDRAGLKSQSIDIVLCTHLHFDHVGWNTMLVDGRWRPTFPRARYLFAEQEFSYWKSRPEREIEDDHAGFEDSVMPVFDAGLADLVPMNYSITDEISLFPTPGHTPAHVSVLIASGQEQAVITGDATHHPCQIAHPDWPTISDTDPGQATVSRRALLDRFVDTQALFIGSHFATPTAGLLQAENNTFRLVVA